MIIKTLSSLMIVFGIVIQSCERTEIPFSEINKSTEYHFGDTLRISSDYMFGLEVNGWPIKPGSERLIDSSFYRIGENTLNFSYKLDGETKEVKRRIIIYPSKEVRSIGFDIVKSYEHGSDIYTEGLEQYNGKIFESGGSYKKSSLIKYNIDNSSKRQEYKHDDKIFAEGITILDNIVYGLTYREYKIFRFNPDNLELIDVRDTPIDFEGWGLTNDGNNLIMSDGTNNIYYLDAKDYSITKILQVYNNMGKQVFVNELEYVDGLIYANIFTKDMIVVIDAETGAVEYSLDLSDISGMHKTQGVLNGIAKLDNGNFLITGKNWDKMYEIKIDKFD